MLFVSFDKCTVNLISMIFVQDPEAAQEENKLPEN